MRAFSAQGGDGYFSLSHKPECVSHREIGVFCEPVVAQSALVMAVRSSSPTLPTAQISQYETPKPLCDRLTYAVWSMARGSNPGLLDHKQCGTFTARPLLAVRHSRCHPPGQNWALAQRGLDAPGQTSGLR
jgi:hypothetical protein